MSFDSLVTMFDRLSVLRYAIGPEALAIAHTIFCRICRHDRNQPSRIQAQLRLLHLMVPEKT